uniref:BTB domain-containing protein n=1 Tax=Steinernema glaseri TaxID=37863 RepID=A0A1I8AQV2_9BILA
MDVGRITGTLKAFGTSAEVEIGGAKWCLCRNNFYFEFRCSVGGGANALWNCTARGKLNLFHGTSGKDSVVWSHSFNSLNTKDGYANYQSFFMPFYSAEIHFFAEVEVIKLHVIDFSPSPNRSIVSSEDGAWLQVDGEKLWLSKKVLSFHSSFFEAMFSGDFKENATGCYVLKGVDINDFKLFLSILYNMDIPVTTQRSLEGLLRLGDIWQCEAVLRFCRDIVGKTDSNFLSLRTQIELCDHYGFWPLLTSIVEKAEVSNVKLVVRRGFCVQLSAFTSSVIMNRLAAE